MQGFNVDKHVEEHRLMAIRYPNKAVTASEDSQFSALAKGQKIDFLSLTEETTIAAAANTDTAIQLPAGAIILAVSARVTTIIPTATTFRVGDPGSANRFSTAAIAVAAGSTDKGTKAGAYYNASATAVRITPDGTPATATGKVIITVHYISVTPPTS